MPVFEGGGRAVPGRLAWGQMCVSAVVKLQYVLALAEEQTGHVS